MKISELRKKTDEELVQNLADLKFTLMQLRFQNKSGNLQDGSQITHTRKAIAQVLTIINERKHQGGNN